MLRTDCWNTSTLCSSCQDEIYDLFSLQNKNLSEFPQLFSAEFKSAFARKTILKATGLSETDIERQFSNNSNEQSGGGSGKINHARCYPPSSSSLISPSIVAAAEEEATTTSSSGGQASNCKSATTPLFSPPSSTIFIKLH
jgi:hypothetical protein